MCTVHSPVVLQDDQHAYHYIGIWALSLKHQIYEVKRYDEMLLMSQIHGTACCDMTTSTSTSLFSIVEKGITHTAQVQALQVWRGFGVQMRSKQLKRRVAAATVIQRVFRLKRRERLRDQFLKGVTQHTDRRKRMKRVAAYLLEAKDPDFVQQTLTRVVDTYGTRGRMSLDQLFEFLRDIELNRFTVSEPQIWAMCNEITTLDGLADHACAKGGSLLLDTVKAYIHERFTQCDTSIEDLNYTDREYILEIFHSAHIKCWNDLTPCVFSSVADRKLKLILTMIEDNIKKHSKAIEFSAFVKCMTAIAQLTYPEHQTPKECPVHVAMPTSEESTCSDGLTSSEEQSGDDDAEKLAGILQNKMGVDPKTAKALAVGLDHAGNRELASDCSRNSTRRWGAVKKLALSGSLGELASHRVHNPLQLLLAFYVCGNERLRCPGSHPSFVNQRSRGMARMETATTAPVFVHPISRSSDAEDVTLKAALGMGLGREGRHRFEQVTTCNGNDVIILSLLDSYHWNL